MFGYIYITTNLINGRQYVGQKRASYFLGNRYLGSGRYLKDAIQKYGKENFKVELLKECNNQDELNEFEIYYISYYRKINNIYNMTDGGRYNRVVIGAKRSEESKARMKAAQNRPEVKKKRSESLKKIPRTEEWKRKISESEKGKNVSEETKLLIANKTKEAMQRPEVKDKLMKGMKKRSKNMFGRVWMNDGVKNVFVKKNEINELLTRGFVYGQFKTRKYNS